MDEVSEPIIEALMEAGFAVAAIEYRFSAEAVFPACLHDAKAAVRWLRAFGSKLGIDANRIGVWGESAGGHLAAFLGLNNTEPSLNGTVGVRDQSADTQAAVVWYAPTSFLTMDQQARGRGESLADDPQSPASLLVGGPLQENPDAARHASPVSHVSSLSAPMLLAHGRQDVTVPYEQSVELHDVLDHLGRPVELNLIEGAEHVFVGTDRAPLIRQAVDFLRAHLHAEA